MTPPSTRRAIWFGAGLIGAVLVVAIAWILVTGLLARHRLEDVRSQVKAYETALAAGHHTRTGELAEQIRASAGSAHQLTSGPAWWVGAHVLGVGTPLRTARSVAYATDRLANDALPRLPALLSDAGSGRSHGGRLDLAGLQRAGGQLTQVRSLVQQAREVVARAPASWLGTAADGRREALGKLTELDTQLGHAQRALATLVPMLGAHHQQRYFIGFLNEAESRSIGGLPGEFAIVTVDDGHFRVEHIGSDDELAGVRARVDLGAAYNRLYAGDDPTGTIQNSDIGPEFPDAARIWAGMWQAKTGEHVDGALTIDPTALGYLLRATGPARLPDGTEVTATNVANLTQSQQYVRYPGYLPEQKLRRKQFLAGIAQAVAARLLAVGSVRTLVAPLRQAVHERRIVVWSDVPGRERAIVAAGLGGVLQPGDGPFSAFFVNNASGSKLDFYLHRTMTYRSSGCAAGHTATASLTLHNKTPTYHLPRYVTYVQGGRPAGQRPGYTKLIVGYYATPGSRVTSVRLDGVPQHLSSVVEDRLTSVRLLVALPADSTRTLTVTTSEPATTGAVQIVAQPLVYALKVRRDQPACVALPRARSGGSNTVALVVVVIGVLLVLAALLLVVVRRRRSTATGPPATGTADP